MYDGVTATKSPEDVAPQRGTRLVIGILLVSAFVMIFNETIMSVALPHLMSDFGVEATTAQWLATGYMLTMAIVIPATGYLLNKYSVRPVFLVAIAVFSVGTLLAAVSPTFAVLLGARVLQAAGTAIMMPLLMTTILNVVPPSRRGRTMGTISIVIAVAPAIGPTISGAILDSLSWRWMFWLVLPISLAALIVGYLKVSNISDTRPAKLDVVSLILSAFGFGGLIFGISSIGESVHGDPIMPIWIPISVGIVALITFVGRQVILQRTDSALLDLRTFRTPAFSVAIVLVFVSMMSLFGALIVLPLYLQNVLLLSTLTTGLLMLPGGLVMAVLSPIVGALSDRFGARPLVIPGALMMSAALWMFAGFLDEQSPEYLVVALHSLLNAGLAFTLTPLLSSALGALQPKLYAHGSATVSTLQQVAGAIGTALFITLMTTGAADQASEGATAIVAGAAGAHSAFVWGAAISLIAVTISFFVKRTQPEGESHATA